MSEIPPVIIKHEIFERLETFSHNYKKVCSMRERLKRQASPEEIIESLERNGVCDHAVAQQLRERWFPPGGGWLGEVFPKIRKRCLEIAEKIGEDGPYFRGWWIAGVTSKLQLVVLEGDGYVTLLMLTPQLDVAAKRKADRGTIERVRGYIEALRQTLAD